MLPHFLKNFNDGKLLRTTECYPRASKSMGRNQRRAEGGERGDGPGNQGRGHQKGKITKITF